MLYVYFNTNFYKTNFHKEMTEVVAVDWLSQDFLADPYSHYKVLRAFEGRSELVQYFDELIARRRAHPQENLISALLAADDRGDFLSQQELLGMLLLLLVGGHETTVNLIANGLLALLRNPDQLELIRTDDGIGKRAIEELLRYDSPVQYSGRVARKDLEIGAKTIRAGDGVRS